MSVCVCVTVSACAWGVVGGLCVPVCLRVLCFKSVSLTTQELMDTVLCLCTGGGQQDQGAAEQPQVLGHGRRGWAALAVPGNAACS